MLYFFNYSTFLGRSGLYLEDLFVFPEMRKRGFGREMFTILARVAKERNCGRFEWACLDWNKPSIEFYKKMGAVPMSDWTVYRISDKALDDLAGMQ
jgi:GNAT superfamily N-acetyltransferase